MPFLAFLRDNARWLAGGFLLLFFAAPGQTFFIALSAGDIRREYGLSHGAFGSLYMVATLATALTLTRVGYVVDRHRAGSIILVVVPMLALAAAAMALSGHVVFLFATIYLLRLFGQGMMPHIAFTTIARWFSAQRGRAVAMAILGLNASQAALPLVFVTLAGALGWRNAWWLTAAALVFLALPAIAWLMAVERTPRASDPPPRVAAARDWTRPEVLRDPLFYLVILAVTPPAFIANGVFFHQVYLVELRGWSLELFASAITLYALVTVGSTQVAGHLVDRVSAVSMLPSYLLPLGLGCLLLGSFGAPWVAFVFMVLYGISDGFSLTLFGALWPEIYGLKHLGAIRAIIMAVTVLASALGPGVTGFLIDRGVSYPGQLAAMGIYCFAISAVILPVSRRLAARARADSEAKQKERAVAEPSE
jgi:MFS family permease